MSDERPRSGHVSHRDLYFATSRIQYARRREGDRMRLRLSELIETLPAQRCNFKDVDVKGVTCDSRQVQPGFLFVAIPGTKADGTEFVKDAIQRGCGAIVGEKPLGELKVPVLLVSSARTALADLAARFYAEPTDRLNVVGVTGTNGKSTTAFLVRSILEAAGEKVGLIGTIQYVVGSRTLNAPMTTPGADDLQRYFWEMANAGCKSAVMEVSSHSLVQQRVRNIRFAAAIFTNITRDHLDYHRTHEEYRAAKGLLFSSLAPHAVAVLNADDPASPIYAGETRAKVTGFGIDQPAQIRATIDQVSFNGTKFRLHLGSEELPILSRLIGRHNVYNMLGAASACWSMGYDLESIKAGLENLTAVPGRLEAVDCGQDFAVLVDYAHTDDALRNVLTCLRPLLRGRLHVVFGCGGDRDRGKRPKMGRVAEEFSDSLIITSDNPRSEEPLDIIRDITQGIVSKTKYLIEPDRRQAIKLAIRMAKKDDVVLIAGKGHENYQIFRDGSHPFDDRQVAREILGESIRHLK